MENWVVNVGLAFGSGIAVFAVLRANVQRLSKANKEHDESIKKINLLISEKLPLLDHLSKSKDEANKKIGNQHDNLVSLKEQLKQAPSMREVRAEFVSKEMFAQMQRHFDDRFKLLEQGISKILVKMEKN